MIWVMDSIPWVRCASGNVYNIICVHVCFFVYLFVCLFGCVYVCSFCCLDISEYCSLLKLRYAGSEEIGAIQIKEFMYGCLLCSSYYTSEGFLVLVFFEEISGNRMWCLLNIWAHFPNVSQIYGISFKTIRNHYLNKGHFVFRSAKANLSESVLIVFVGCDQIVSESYKENI